MMLMGQSSKHGEVHDFDWVRPGPSPNWRATEILSTRPLELLKRIRQRVSGETSAIDEVLEAFGIEPSAKQTL
jgi:hypothetical protein